MKILLTGGSGFIGSAVIRQAIAGGEHDIVNIHHAETLLKVVEIGMPGATYCIGARQPRRNIEVARTICSMLDQKLPSPNGAREWLITSLRERPGHDHRYEIDAATPRERAVCIGKTELGRILHDIANEVHQ